MLILVFICPGSNPNPHNTRLFQDWNRFKIVDMVSTDHDDFNGPWVQLDGYAEVLDMPAALEGLVEYFRSISGEHPDWDDYRVAMARQGKRLLRLTIERWGPIATGGFPPRLAG